MDKIRTPNFSVILPGHCNSNCDFCFWSFKKSPSDWHSRLLDTIKSLPSEYTRCSISGGEPGMSPALDSAIDLINNARDWDAIILTTNGTGLLDHIDCLKGVDHINLSRHHFDERVNLEIFHPKSPLDTPRESKLKRLCSELNRMGIDVNINCVLCNQFANSNEILQFLNFVKSIGAQSVCFRQDQKLNSTDMPKEMNGFIDHKAIESWSCPACKAVYQYLEGIKVSWKAAIAEPSVATKQKYEIIYHQNGIATYDWAGTVPFLGKTTCISPDVKKKKSQQ